jgi:hypothetical protein
MRLKQLGGRAATLGGTLMPEIFSRMIFRAGFFSCLSGRAKTIVGDAVSVNRGLGMSLRGC